MNAKISVFDICVEASIYLLLYNLHDCTFNNFGPFVTISHADSVSSNNHIRRLTLFLKISVTILNTSHYASPSFSIVKDVLHPYFSHFLCCSWISSFAACKQKVCFSIISTAPFNFSISFLYSGILQRISFRPVDLFKEVLYLRWNERHLSAYFGTLMTPFFFMWVLHKHSRSTGQQGKGEAISLTPLYRFYLHIASSRTLTGNLWFPSGSR